MAKALVKPRLSLSLDDPRAQIVLEEIGQYSITPRTFESRDLVDRAWYIDRYSYSNNNVVRYGIDSRNIEVDRDAQTLDKVPVVFYDQESQEKLSQSTAAIKSAAETVQHHPLEKHLVTESIRYLLAEVSHRTVLVDIFARENGAVKILASGYPETHTVLLYKNPPTIETGKHIVSVIDPSNFSFSSHLSNLNIQLVEEFANLDKIITIHKSLQIYKPLGDIGPQHNQYRDCIDIATKLAFGFNKLEEQVNFETIATHKVVKAISNLPKIDTAIITRDIPARIKQTSDTDIVQKFHTIEELITKNLSIASAASTYYPELLTTVTSVRELHRNILSSNDSLPNILYSLVGCNLNCITGLSQTLNEEHEFLVKTIGEVSQGDL
jgi:hypothetical protein